VHAGEQVVPQETLLHKSLFGRDIHRIGVLYQHRRHRRPAVQRILVVHQHRSDARMVEIADIGIAKPRALQKLAIQLQHARIRMKRATAFILPAAGHRRHRKGRMHVHRTVALARKAVAQAKEGLPGRTDQPSKGLDLLDRKPGDFRRPLRRLVRQMRLKPLGIISVFFEIGAVGQLFPEQNVHDGAGQCAVGAGLQHEAHVGLLHRGVFIDVDDDDLGAALFARLDGVGHHIDLRDHGIGAPDDHAIGFRHFAWIAAAQRAGAHHIAGPGKVGADRAEKAGISLGVAQPFYAVALHQPHRASIEIGPHRIRAVFFFRRDEFFGDQIEGCFPARFLPAALAFGTRTDQRLQQTVGMMHAVGITGDLGADDAGGVAVALGAMEATDSSAVQQFDVERAGRGAVVRTGRMADS
jgi:hypothetical protein